VESFHKVQMAFFSVILYNTEPTSAYVCTRGGQATSWQKFLRLKGYSIEMFTRPHLCWHTTRDWQACQKWSLMQINTERSKNRVARWFLFKPKIPIGVNFGGPQIGKCWYVYYLAIWNSLQTFGIFYDHLVYFVFIFSLFLVSWTKKNLATLNKNRWSRKKASAYPAIHLSAETSYIDKYFEKNAQKYFSCVVRKMILTFFWSICEATNFKFIHLNFRFQCWPLPLNNQEGQRISYPPQVLNYEEPFFKGRRNGQLPLTGYLVL
jgi:hypothetical protein